MALYELYDARGDGGMLIAGDFLDTEFRIQADKRNRPDERLITVTDPDILLEPAALQEAVLGAFVASAGLDALQNPNRTPPN